MRQRNEGGTRSRRTRSRCCSFATESSLALSRSCNPTSPTSSGTMTADLVRTKPRDEPYDQAADDRHYNNPDAQMRVPGRSRCNTQPVEKEEVKKLMSFRRATAT